MINDQTRNLLLAAATDFGVPLAAYVLGAQKLHDAAVEYVTAVEMMTAPNLGNMVAAKDIGPTVDALLAWPQRDEKLRHARRVEVETRTRLNAAVARFRAVMFSALAPIFDTAAGDFTARYDAGEGQEPATVATLRDLVRTRDLLAGRVDDGFPMTHSDEPTRVALWRSRNDMQRLRHRAFGMERGSKEWLEAVLSLHGQLKWQTRSEQIAHVTALPAGERPLATASRGGDAA